MPPPVEVEEMINDFNPTERPLIILMYRFLGFTGEKTPEILEVHKRSILQIYKR